ncbi:MAG: hypothetical protein GY847_18090 [Proteobacteria bacterium]|nr:hypothetical protein [Pseudomonadota bacterium]
MKVNLGGYITNDDDYLRDDDDDVQAIISFSQQIWNAVGTRRMGKTSFLKKIERRAREQGIATVYTSLDSTLEASLEYFAQGLGTNRLGDLNELSSILNSHKEKMILLLDECHANFRSSTDSGPGFGYTLLNMLTSVCQFNEKLALVVADTPIFFSACKKEGNGIPNLVVKPMFLRPVLPSQKSPFLQAAGDNYRPELQRYIGGVPIELQYLRHAMEEADSEKMDKEIHDHLYDMMEPWYSGFFYTLDFDQQDALILLAHQDNVEREQLRRMAGPVLRSLNAMGLVTYDAPRWYIAGQNLKDYVLEHHHEHERQEQSQRLLEKFDASPVSAPRISQPTYTKEFIVHQISDLHFGLFGKTYVGKKLSVCTNYLHRLKRLNPPNRPHVIVICGDVTSTASPDEFDEFKRFIESLKENGSSGHPILEPLIDGGSVDYKSQIMVVPGNHDTRWKPETGEQMQGSFERFKSVVKDLGIASPFDDLSGVCFGGPAVTFYMLNSAHRSGMIMPFEAGETSSDSRKIKEIMDATDMTIKKAYREIADRFFSKIETMGTHNEKERADVLHAIVRFTSGYLKRDHLNNMFDNFNNIEKHPIDLKSPDEPTLRIAICHHNVNPFFGPSVFTDLINSCDLWRNLCDSKTSILMHGHLHKDFVVTESDHNRGGQTFHTICASSLGAIGSENGFNEIRLGCGFIGPNGNVKRKVTITQYSCSKADDPHNAYYSFNSHVNVEVG